MPAYSHFIGIDIGKSEVVVATAAAKSTVTFPNTQNGFRKFLKSYNDLLKDALVILETTGGYERLFLYELTKLKIPVHRANTRHVKAFVRSYGVKGKSDAIDALQLARYGQERCQTLELYQWDSSAETLRSFAERRLELTQILVAEKNRLQAPATSPLIRESCQKVIEILESAIKEVTQELDAEISKSRELTEKKEVLKTIPGIGETLSTLFVVLLPELGRLNRRQIASLAGVAPHPRESGTKQGYRRTFGGRPQVKQLLFMAAMTAGRSKSKVGEFYQKLVNTGKKKMVALVAVMRKIIVIANARIKDFLNQNNRFAVVADCEKCA